MTGYASRALRVGVAGLGFGAAVHVPALKKLTDVEVVGVTCQHFERGKEVARHFGVAHATASVSELLDLNLDAITVALPPDQTAEVVRKALSRGIAVLCEKPLGISAVQADELAALAHDRVTAMDFIFGELDTFIRLKDIIASGSLGAVRHANVLWLTESWAHRKRIWSWKTDASRGGGAGTLFGTHLYFLAEWLFGPARYITAVAGKPVSSAFAPNPTNAAEDLIQCTSTHSGDVLCSATFGNANPGLSVHRWTVVFETGHAILENTSTDYIGGFELAVYQTNQPVIRIQELQVNEDGRIQPFCRLASRFLNGVRLARPVFPDFSIGARVQAYDELVKKCIAHHR